jgi:hypothetical protein
MMCGIMGLGGFWLDYPLDSYLLDGYVGILDIQEPKDFPSTNC